ncbi:MAG: hypothetical protein PHZ02_02715 [Desulfocapsaceae bacterium]|nr:hypothetical protein [Desulfocapsaceae bacterium]
MPEQKNIACDFAIVGVLGDLSRRKLIPSLYQLDREGVLHSATPILGIARYDLSHADFVGKKRAALATFDKNALDEEVVARLLALRPITVDNVDDQTMRGQYAGGFIKGNPVPFCPRMDGRGRNN